MLIIGIVITLIIIFLIILFTKKKNKLLLIFPLILIIFLAYSFFTYNGAVRLGIVLASGDVVSAYTTKIDKSVSRGNNNKYFHPIKDIKITSGSMNDLECKNYLIVKICKYYGF